VQCVSQECAIVETLFVVVVARLLKF